MVTEDDYLDFLVHISEELKAPPPQKGQRRRLAGAITTALKSTSLLFMSYSLSDVNFRVIVRGLVHSLDPSSKRLHVTVQLRPQIQHDNQSVQESEINAEEIAQAREREVQELMDYVARYFDHMLKVQVYWGDAQEFARELTQLREERRNREQQQV